MGRLPEAWIAPPATRELRELVRRRAKLVGAERADRVMKGWQFEWAQWGLELDASDFFVNHGGDITEERYTQLGEAVGERFDLALSHRRRSAFRDPLHESLDLVDGMRSWILEATQSGTRLAVASSREIGWSGIWTAPAC